MGQIKLTVEELNGMKPTGIVKSDAVRDKFISIYDTLWGAGTGEGAYERESIHFNKLLCDNASLQQCTNFSLFTAFIDLAVCGLSLEPGTRALCYLLSRNYKTGNKRKDGRDEYENRAVLTVSAYGELVLRERSGQIRHADNPVLVYDNDEFSFSDMDGQKRVSYVCHLPHAGQRIVACYLRITRTDGSIDYAVMTEEDWARLAEYSAKGKNGPNSLYGKKDDGLFDIDSGFLMAKCIRHAFRTYPKVRVGRGTELQSNQEEETVADGDYYGVDGAAETVRPAAEASGPEAFGPPEHVTQTGVTVDTEGEDDAF